MKFIFALIAAAVAIATAQASVADTVLANAIRARAILNTVKSNQHRQLDGDPDGQPINSYIKGKCVKGQATDMVAMKRDAGVDLVIPTAGYCMNTGDGESMLLTCAGVTR